MYLRLRIENLTTTPPKSETREIWKAKCGD